jgi:hypothetical protein
LRPRDEWFDKSAMPICALVGAIGALTGARLRGPSESHPLRQSLIENAGIWERFVSGLDGLRPRAPVDARGAGRPLTKRLADNGRAGCGPDRGSTALPLSLNYRTDVKVVFIVCLAMRALAISSPRYIPRGGEVSAARCSRLRDLTCEPPRRYCSLLWSAAQPRDHMRRSLRPWPVFGACQENCCNSAVFVLGRAQSPVRRLSMLTRSFKAEMTQST